MSQTQGPFPIIVCREEEVLCAVIVDLPRTEVMHYVWRSSMQYKPTA